MKYKIIVDSSCDLAPDYIKDENVGFEIAPLTINIGDKNFVDDQSLDVKAMLDAVENAKGWHKPKSSCPNPNDYAKLFGDAECVFIVTISSKLSGSYNSAMLACEEFSHDNILVIDSKATSGVMIKIVDELYRLIKANLEFEQIKEKILKYRDERQLYFVLDRYDNLINNGRISHTIAMLCKVLRIKILCVADNGEIKLCSKVRTRNGVLNALINNVKAKEDEMNTDECIITHCFDNEAAEYIADDLKQNSKFKSIRIINTKGLCSFYALSKGIIVSF